MKTLRGRARVKRTMWSRRAGSLADGGSGAADTRPGASSDVTSAPAGALTPDDAEPAPSASTPCDAPPPPSAHIMAQELSGRCQVLELLRRARRWKRKPAKKEVSSDTCFSKDQT